MRQFINLLEGFESNSVEEGLVVADVHMDEPDYDMAAEIEREFQRYDLNLRQRRNVEDVYLLVLDGIGFEDAVTHIATRAQLDPLDLRSACVDDYKMLRGQSSTYDSPSGHALVNALNPIIREAIEATFNE